MNTQRQTTKQERDMDNAYRSHEDLLHRIIVRLFRRHINRVVKAVIGRAFERSQIDSFTFHELAGCCDRMLWPEYYAPKTSVVQKNNIVGGDMAGGDITK